MRLLTESPTILWLYLCSRHPVKSVCSWSGWRRTTTTPTHPRSMPRRTGLWASRRMEAASVVLGLTTARKPSCFSLCQSPLTKEIHPSCHSLPEEPRGSHSPGGPQNVPLTFGCTNPWSTEPKYASNALLLLHAWFLFQQGPFPPAQFRTEGPTCLQGSNQLTVWA